MKRVLRQLGTMLGSILIIREPMAGSSLHLRIDRLGHAASILTSSRLVAGSGLPAGYLGLLLLIKPSDL